MPSAQGPRHTDIITENSHVQLSSGARTLTIIYVSSN